jgi:hypothetical protein
VQKGKYSQHNKINKAWQHSQYNSPKHYNDKSAGHGQNSFPKAVTVPIEKSSRDDKRRQEVQPAQSKKTPGDLQYLAGGIFGWALGEIRTACHDVARIPFSFGIILIAAGLFVWLVKWVKRQKSCPLEPFGPIWDPVGQLLFWGTVFMGFGIIFRVV